MEGFQSATCKKDSAHPFLLAFLPRSRDNMEMGKSKDKKKPEPKEDKLAPGPEPERIKIDMPWKEAVKKALRKKPKWASD